MSAQFRGLNFYEVGLHVLDDSISNFIRKQVNDRGMKFSRCGERPPLDSIAFGDLRDLVGQLFIDTPISLVLQFGFSNRRSMLHTGAIAYRETPRLIGHLVEQLSVSIRDVESLDEM